MKKSASCIVIDPGAVICVINQSTLVLARVHIIHTKLQYPYFVYYKRKQKPFQPEKKVRSCSFPSESFPQLQLLFLRTR